ncbi:MAG: exodeoxyribonuclease I [Desulfobacula sp.]|nr:exodeoxyribonuclease I [Desulfobacula sp.]
MQTFLFYDLETTGLNPAFDQVLTIACIRTDLDLNEIEKQAITICLRNDIVPSPMAFLTHGLTYAELKLGISEYQAAQKIHKMLNTPGTISLGYNSLGFDDEFLRFLFYRNLLDPYSHQYNNGCYRMDILPITIVFRIFHPESLKWPQIKEKSSLKLELISKANNFKISGKAHEAMSDVEAVIELAKIMSAKKNIWIYCLDFFKKTKDEVRINNIKGEFKVAKKTFKICLMLSTSFGSQNNYMVPVIHLGQSTAYKNQTLWMRLDSDELPGIGSQIDLKETFVIRKRPADALIVLPALERFKNKMSVELRDKVKRNMEIIKLHTQRFFKFIQYHQEYKYPFIPDLDPDAALYQDGFFSFKEKNQSTLFHGALKNSKFDYNGSKILDEIESPRIKILAKRILYRNFNNEKWQTDEIEQTLNLKRLRSRSKEDQIPGYKNDIKYNCNQGLEELKEIEQENVHLDDDTKKMLKWLKKYIKNL